MRRALLAALALAAAVTAALTCKTVLASCRCGGGKLELVFVIDATGSMGQVIGTVKAQASRMVEILEGQLEQLRVGGVAFRSRTDPEMPQPLVLDFHDDRRRFAEWIGPLQARGGGEEALDDALAAALDRIGWGKDARKVIVLIGDESPSDRIKPEFLRLAAECRRRGITLHTITASATAWLYHLNIIRNTDPALLQRTIDRYGSMEELKRSFIMPEYEAASVAGGGRAVGTSDTNMVVRWLVAFALALDDDEPPEIDLDSAPVADRGASTVASTRSAVARVRYAGEWNTPRAFDGLVRHLNETVEIDLSPEMDNVSLADESNWKRPLLYLSGHGPVALDAAEIEGLRGYLTGDGLVWADNCCGRAAFDRTLRESLRAAFPETELIRLDADHAVFSIGHAIKDVRYTEGHRKGVYSVGAPHVEALVLDGRVALLYTPHGIGSGWKTYRFGAPCLMHDDDALRMSANILLYALSR